MQIIVTPTKRGKHKLYRVSYGPYNTLCQISFILETKKQISKLTIDVCPKCGK